MVCVLDITLTQLFHSLILFVINKLEFRFKVQESFDYFSKITDEAEISSMVF